MLGPRRLSRLLSNWFSSFETLIFGVLRRRFFTRPAGAAPGLAFASGLVASGITQACAALHVFDSLLFVKCFHVGLHLRVCLVLFTDFLTYFRALRDVVITCSPGTH